MIGMSDKTVPEISELEWRLAFTRAASALTIESWYRKKDERATDQLINPERLRLRSADTRHLSALIGQLVELRTAEESDEYGILRATEHAYNVACHLVIDAAIMAALEAREIPHGYASTDSEGGVRIEWIRPTSSIHLVVPATSGCPAYIYHEVGDAYATEPATAERLARWLREVARL
jgi:hypothetical protein